MFKVREKILNQPPWLNTGSTTAGTYPVLSFTELNEMSHGMFKIVPGTRQVFIWRQLLLRFVLFLSSSLSCPVTGLVRAHIF